MFKVDLKIYGLVYNSRDLRYYIVDIRFTDVRIKDLL